MRRRDAAATESSEAKRRKLDVEAVEGNIDTELEEQVAEDEQPTIGVSMTTSEKVGEWRYVILAQSIQEN